MPRRRASRTRWEDTLERDAKIDRQERHQVIVRRVPARWADHPNGHGADGSIRRVIGAARSCARKIAARGWGLQIAGGGIRQNLMGVRGKLGELHGDSGSTGLFADDVGRKAWSRAGARVERDIALQIGQGKICRPVASEIGAEDREKCRILGERENLTGTERPPGGGEVHAKHANFTKKLIGHKRGGY